MSGIGRRLRKEEDGYALVISVILLFVMMMLLVIGLQAGNSALEQSQRGIEWTRTLTVAESGVNDMIAQLSNDRAASSPCPPASDPCTAEGGEYLVDWSGSGSSVVITSTGYYPALDTAEITRTVRVTLEPAPTFRYALFSQDFLEVKNNPVVTGDIYSQVGVLVGSNTTICGSVVVAGGDVTMENNARVAKELALTGCSGKDGMVWVGGSINATNGVVIEGDAKASAPTGTPCSPAGTSYQIAGGSVLGNATACGQITGSVSGTSLPGVNTAAPPVIPLPTFTFDPANYPDVNCYPSVPSCDETNTSATAVSTANVAIDAVRTTMSGDWAIWQQSPSQSTVVDLDGIVLDGDTTIVTNAPIDFGNTSSIELAAGVEAANLIVISLYVPTGTCGTNGGDCSIYGKNAIEFDRADLTDPNDGVAGLLYTTGKMAFKNKGVPGEGALYAGSMDIKNGFDIVYNSRIEKVLGFGTALETVLWEELDPS
ncbi:MAG: hypothetical protein ACRDHI_03355 [Actinomycetota bacterium]